MTTTPYAQDKVAIGHYLMLRYGHGTQLAYVANLRGNKRVRVTQTRRGKLTIYRLIGYTSKWSGPYSLNSDDPRIESIVAERPLGAPLPPEGDSQ